ncbi:MAG TPA: hypothetical protein VF916_13425 [Ktedonobacterales bacterium]
MLERILPSIAPAARNLIAKHRKLDHFMILTTATSRFLTAPIARELGFENLSDFRESWFYSDSQNDLPLLSHVTHPVAVNADPVLAAHARHKGWPQITIG